MATNAAHVEKRHVNDPNAVYESLKPLWNKSRAVCSGERFVKEMDKILDTKTFTNLLIPFSSSMSPKQYRFYRSEAELPGITSQFAKMLVGGLLRKQPVLKLSEDDNEEYEEIKNWLIHSFDRNNSPLVSFLDKILWEEVQTSGVWIQVDFPKVNPDEMDKEDLDKLKPFPVIWEAEKVINWKTSTDNFGITKLTQLILKGTVESYEEDEFHPTYKDTVWVHDLDESGHYRVRTYEAEGDSEEVPVVSGHMYQKNERNAKAFKLVETNDNILVHDERLDFIPIWPFNGTVEPAEPMLSAIIDKELSLYNKLSRRNHLLYGASTYTPVVSSNMEDSDFRKLKNAGLGSWLKIEQGDSINVLETPTAALADMESAIAAAIEEMAKLGIRMLTPETAQSGVALEIRNAAQTAQLGTLNTKISNILIQVFSFMIYWRYEIEIDPKDIEFTLSSDFNPVPLGSDWMRMVTEWYQEGLIPRSSWLLLLKQNDLLPPDFDDKAATEEIANDELIAKNQDDGSGGNLNQE